MNQTPCGPKRIGLGCMPLTGIYDYLMHTSSCEYQQRLIPLRKACWRRVVLMTMGVGLGRLAIVAWKKGGNIACGPR